MLHKRDSARSPMQWSPSKHAGFTQGDETWLPVGDNYETKNVHVSRKIEIFNSDSDV